MKKSLILLFIFLSSCSNISQKSIISDLQRKIDLVLDDSNFNGVVLVSKKNITIYSKTKGFSNIEKKIKLNLFDQFVIGSISKQITAVLILREVEKGNIRLTDKINKFLPKIEQLWSKKVTIHHLLTHTHGIRSIKEPLEFELASKFKYSQLGYNLLANILEKVTNQSFENLATELFNEYKLSSTFHPNNKIYKNLVNGYKENKNGEMIFATNSLQNYAAAGSFISNAKDLSSWNELLHSGKLVKKETLELMKTKYATRKHPIFEEVEYGYGLLFKDGEENIQIGALGYAPGFVSASYYYPKTKLNLIVLGNTARDLDDFKKVFGIHIKIMKIINNEHPTMYIKS